MLTSAVYLERYLCETARIKGDVSSNADTLPSARRPDSPSPRIRLIVDEWLVCKSHPFSERIRDFHIAP